MVIFENYKIDCEKPMDLIASPKTEYQKIYARALRFLAAREHAPKELAKKLAPACPEQIQSVLADLTEQNYLNLERYAESYARSRVGRGFGRLDIEARLRLQLVPNTLIQTIMAEYDWCALARKARAGRFGAKLNITIQDKAKQWRFLLQRGFDSESCKAAFMAGEP